MQGRISWDTAALVRVDNPQHHGADMSRDHDILGKLRDRGRQSNEKSVFAEIFYRLLLRYRYHIR